MDTYGREVLLHQQLGQCSATLNGLHEDDDLKKSQQKCSQHKTLLGSDSPYLVELQDIKQVEELSVLLPVLQLDIVLLESMEGQFGLVVNVNFHGLWVDKMREGQGGVVSVGTSLYSRSSRNWGKTELPTGEQVRHGTVVRRETNRNIMTHKMEH